MPAFQSCVCGKPDTHYARICPAKVFKPRDRVIHVDGWLGTVTRINAYDNPCVLWDGAESEIVADSVLMSVIKENA